MIPAQVAKDNCVTVSDLSLWIVDGQKHYPEMKT